MNWSLAQSKRGGCLRGGLPNSLLRVGRKARWRHVNRLFEIWSNQWVRLVEQRQDRQLAGDQQAFHGDFDTRNVVLDQHLTRGRIIGLELRLADDACHLAQREL